MRAPVLLLTVLLGCAHAEPPPPMTPPASLPEPTAAPATAPVAAPSAAPACPRATTLEPAALQAELTCLLAHYVQLDTTNPPGNERIAAEFLRDVLARDGIASEILDSAPGRANLIARIEGSSDDKALMLVHHMDVVPASAEEWSVPPLSGVVKDGELWGRGALDDKGPGAMALLTVLMLKRLGTPPPRDVVFLAVADEEAGSAMGSRWLMDQHFDRLADVGFALNEGGGIADAGEGKVMARVEVAQKAPLWLRLTARGPSGHGSSPRPDAATHVLVRALSRLEQHRFEVKVVPAVQAVFTERAASMPKAEAAAYKDLAASLKNKKFREKFLADPHQAALVQNTLSITMLSGSNKENVLPPSATAVLDMRILPGEDPAKVIEEVKRVMAEPAVEVETMLSWQAHASSRDTPLFAAIEALMAERFPGAPVTANVIGGFTDCNAFRARGITCYGFVPAPNRMEDLHRIHGKDERIRLDTLAQGVVNLTRLIALLK